MEMPRSISAPRGWSLLDIDGLDRVLSHHSRSDIMDRGGYRNMSSLPANEAAKFEKEGRREQPSK